MLRICFGLGVLAVLVFVAAAHASPLSVRIEDHDFSFDVPYWPAEPWGAVYSFNGAAADTLTLQAPKPNHYVSSYTYEGTLPTVPPNPLGVPPVPDPFGYPVSNSNTFRGDLDLNMTFDSNDGPYVDTNNGDQFDISLVGKNPQTDFLTITGQIFGQGPMTGLAALYPAAPVPNDVILLHIELEEVTLLARTGEDHIFKVEGKGTLTTLLGVDISTMQNPLEVGVTFFVFNAKSPQAPIFINPIYQPSDDVAGSILGSMNGAAGVPEPATMAMLAIGGLALVLRRRR